MNGCKRFAGMCLSALTCKVLGILAFSFCIGTAAGLFLPIAAVAFIETVLLLLLAYMCLFRW